MTKLRRTLKGRYARQLFAGAVDHAARSAYSVRLQPSVHKTVLRLTLAMESMFLHWMSAALGLQRGLNLLNYLDRYVLNAVRTPIVGIGRNQVARAALEEGVLTVGGNCHGH